MNSIGAFQFRNFLGRPPQMIGRQVEVLQYAGTNYQAVRTLGLRSAPFQVGTIVDLMSAAIARNEFAGYKSMIGDGAKQMVWNNWNMDNEGQRVVVLDVIDEELAMRARICGGLNPPSLVDLRVTWTLLLVPF